MTFKQLSIFTFLFLGLFAYGQTESCACCTENHTAFDFWEGKWEVTNSDGTKAGTNTIEKIQGGCILKENWIGSSGSTGTSLNFYNLKTEQWEQLWVDNSGSHLKLEGNRVRNKMILSSEEFTHTNGKDYINRITWTLNEDGTVRQLWEILEKEKVVNIAFDGLYKKVQ